jgi:import receptor subunit TOM70
MAPVEGRTESSVFEGWEKWQIALAVGAPVCLGLAGLWYYTKVKKSDQTGDDLSKAKPPSAKEKVKSPDASKVASGSQKENESKVTG